jgi:hypothetical protein
LQVLLLLLTTQCPVRALVKLLRGIPWIHSGTFLLLLPNGGLKESDESMYE